MNKFVCRCCNATFPLNDIRWKCDCGSVLDIQFKPIFDIDKIIRSKPTMWRYREAIPIEKDENIVSLDEGFTPLISIEIENRPLLIKLEQLFTTGSYKDRGASVLISKVKELGIERVVEDSSGNAGCAIAAYSARAGIECDIYVPAATSPGKLAQIQMYGARLHKISGSRQETARAVLKAAESSFYASHCWNPFFFHGTKTFAFEIWEQLGFKAPDALIMPVGNGTLLIGAYIGFKDLIHQGLIKNMPKIIGVQAANCAPLLHMYHQGSQQLPCIIPGDTMAEGIAIAHPVRGQQIVDIIVETRGEIISVTDQEIQEAVIQLARNGLYVEPTSAVAVAGFKKYSGKQMVVVPLTGHGLKSTEKMLKIAEKINKQSRIDKGRGTHDER